MSKVDVYSGPPKHRWSQNKVVKHQLGSHRSEPEDAGDNDLGNMPRSREEGDEKGWTTTTDGHNLTNSSTTPNPSLVEERARGPTQEVASTLSSDYVLFVTLDGVRLLGSTPSRAFVDVIMKDSRVCKGTKIAYVARFRLVSQTNIRLLCTLFSHLCAPRKNS